MKAGADSASTLQPTYIERWLTNCLTCTKRWLVCSDGIARFCRSMLACGMVAEVDPVLRNELNMVLMVVAPPSLSLDLEEANKVDQVFELLSSAVGAGDSWCGYFHKFPVMLESIRDTMRILQSNMINGQRWLSMFVVGVFVSLFVCFCRCLCVCLFVYFAGCCLLLVAWLVYRVVCLWVGRFTGLLVCLFV